MHLHLVEPVGIGALGQRIDEGHLGAPLRQSQLPNVGDGAALIDLGVVGPHIGIGGNGQRVLEARRDLVSQIGRQPAFDKAIRQQLRHGRRCIGDQRHVTLDIVGLALPDDHLQLTIGRNFLAHGFEPVLGLEIGGHVDDLAGAVIDGDRRLVLGGSEQFVHRLGHCRTGHQAGRGRQQQGSFEICVHSFLPPKITARGDTPGGPWVRPILFSAAPCTAVHDQKLSSTCTALQQTNSKTDGWWNKNSAAMQRTFVLADEARSSAVPERGGVVGVEATNHPWRYAADFRQAGQFPRG